MICCDLTDNGSFPSIRALLQGFKQLRCIFLWGENDEASFTGQIQRIQSQHAAYTAYCRRNGKLRGIEADADVAFFGNFIEHRAGAAASCITHGMDCGSFFQQGAYHRP